METLLLELEEGIEEITLTYLNDISHYVEFHLKEGTVVTVSFSGTDKLVRVVCRDPDFVGLDQTLQKLLMHSEFGFSEEEQESIINYPEDNKMFTIGTWDMNYHDSVNQTVPGKVFSMDNNVNKYEK